MAYTDIENGESFGSARQKINSLKNAENHLVSNTTKTLYGVDNTDACLQHLNNYVQLNRPLELTTGVIFENGAYVTKDIIGKLIPINSNCPTFTLKTSGIAFPDNILMNSVTYRYLFSKSIPIICQNKRIKVTVTMAGCYYPSVGMYVTFDPALYTYYSAQTVSNVDGNVGAPLKTFVYEIDLPNINTEISIPCYIGLGMVSGSSVSSIYQLTITKIEITNKV